MDDYLIYPLINYLQTLNGESLSMLSFLIGITMILLMFRFFGLVGLYVYSSTAMILANIQVLKLMTLSLTVEPVALGTATFSTVFLCNDIITEHYGVTFAKKNTWLCFVTQIMVTIIMLIAIGFKPVEGDSAHNAIIELFVPTPRLLAASLIAFVISQFVNIEIFHKLSNYFKAKKLWLRSNVALMLSELIDNIIFSSLAWVILAPKAVSLDILIYTYILGTYIFRVIFALFSTPVIYWSYYFKPKES
jgi:queuosine precursor transporter